MSWGASLLRLPKGMTIGEIAEKHGNDWKPPPVGTAMDVANALKSLFPDAQHFEGQMVHQHGSAYVQFNYEDRKGTGIVERIGVVSNADEECIGVIKAVCERLDLRMVDHQSGEVADFAVEPQRSMEDYRDFRDRAINKDQQGE